jgi:hypothetical protein
MQLIDQIEKRRFVGREFLLWLWMESELFEGTLTASPQGSFEGGELGLWIEKKLVLSAGEESTRITAAAPGLGRAAKEALRRGQLPEAAGIRIAWKGDETSLAMDAESLALRGLKLRTLLDEGAEASFAGDLVDEMAGRRRPGKPTRRKTEDEEDVGEDAAFHERMVMTRELEDLLAALYRDFLALRLGSRWDAAIVPTMRRWAAGEEIAAYAYEQSKRGKKHEATAPGKRGGGRARR